MYHYEECGLSNIWLRNGFTIENDEDYGELVSIESVHELHNAIGLFLITQKPDLNGEEIRFLRKELNLSQKNLAGLLGVSETSIRHWEADRGLIGKPTELLLRALYKEHVQADGKLRSMIESLNHQERTLVPSEISFSYGNNHSWHQTNCEIA
ncbi:TPA: helix-turn-helix domain-containing protein [Acinetobacter baumannii]|uniref:Helix-turn-helix domain-containing protein n=9 Tax=Acinetobacter baumannii TaxID=470 RepID=A0A6B2PWB2_ACIBA|nr:helix-turn-helix domain-containing protein [Acinetobacter baumannii]ELT5076973.1 helix-turn-helix domain-containing protein [Acinetobacter baumannii]MCG6656067.1 helix-turn-helix domain-containing protein [Acinetobacter baumannii]MEE1853340.1 helix-turn-helix domain-containing protein [Acinetobacter baumannii]NDM76321.1 helix-turn-helix domain-containing protein [Acinetobacter baumannii]NDN73779.1 helix-turn-helix domain-containing protein [Acinetobacter baumannii]